MSEHDDDCICHETVHGKTSCPVHGEHPAVTEMKAGGPTVYNAEEVIITYQQLWCSVVDAARTEVFTVEVAADRFERYWLDDAGRADAHENWQRIYNQVYAYALLPSIPGRPSTNRAPPY